MDAFLLAALTAALVSFHRAAYSGVSGSATGGEAIPAIAVQFNALSGRYELWTANAEPPDAYFVLVGDAIELQSGVSSGLTIVEDSPGSFSLNT